MRSGFRRFVRAALALTSRRQSTSGARKRSDAADVLDEPRLFLTGEPRLVPSSAGGANLVATVETRGGMHVMKARIDVHDGASIEARAIRRAGPDIAPTLLFSTTSAALVTLAMRRARHDLLADLDIPLGGVLYTSFIDGKHPTHIDDAVITRTAQALATLWSRKSEDLATLRVPSSPQGLLRMLESTRVAIEQHRLLDKKCGAMLDRALKAVRTHVARALDEHEWDRVRTLCHGDLRWHNLLDDTERVRFVDFEHAGAGDPALDLAMMTARTPLPLHVEHALLDGILAHRRDRTFLDRYFGLRPLVAIIAGMSALEDIALVVAGARAVEGDRAAYARARRSACTEELCEAVDRALAGTRPLKKPTAKLRVRIPKALPSRVRRQRVPPGVIAVDGTAASGKSVLAAILASSFAVPHWNTGAVYRAIALEGLTTGIDPSDARAIARLATRVKKRHLLMTDDGGVALSDSTPSSSLSLYEVDRVVAQFAAHKAIRAVVDDVLARTRDASRARAVLIEGRDIGTVLATNARVRFFVDADEAIRAARVHERIVLATAAHQVPPKWREARDRAPTLAAVTRATVERDMRDRTRALAPMRVPEGAIVIDTTTGSGEENAKRMLPHLFSSKRPSPKSPSKKSKTSRPRVRERRA